MTRTELREHMENVIDDVIFGLAEHTGKFPRGIWMFRLSDHVSCNVEITGVKPEQLEMIGALARKQRAEFKPDFTIIAVESLTATVAKDAPAGTKAMLEAAGLSLDADAIDNLVDAGHAKKQVLYSFLGYAPNTGGHVLAFQHYKRAKDRSVSLVGKLRFAKKLPELGSEPEIVDPWRELDDHDRELLAKIDGELNINAAINAARNGGKLTMEKLFPAKAKE